MERNMVTEPYLIFYIVLLALAMSMFGAVLHAKTGFKPEPPAGSAKDVFKFEDCYDLCRAEASKEPSRCCASMCFSHGGACSCLK
jgi:hypothetical protein